LGALLKTAREDAGTSLEELSARSGRYPVDELAAIEAGDRTLDDHEVDRVVALYGVERDALVPDRDELVIDLDHHELAAAGHTQPLAGAAPTPEEVLGTYLTLVYTLRAAEPGTPVRLRQADLDVLAQALALATSDVEQRLEGLMAGPQRVVLQQRAKLLRTRVLVPAAGVLVAVCVGGALVVWARSSSEPSSSPQPTTTTIHGPAAVAHPGASTTTTPASVPPTSTPGAPATVEGNGLRHDQIPAGSVGLAPAQVVTRSGDGQPVQSDRGDAGSTSTTLAG
jgi:hypothetical protein